MEHENKPHFGRPIDYRYNPRLKVDVAPQYHYEHAVILRRPSDMRDPRKSWIYDVLKGSIWRFKDVDYIVPGKWNDPESGSSWEPEQRTGCRVYMFKSEQDAMLFQLRWEGENASAPG